MGSETSIALSSETNVDTPKTSQQFIVLPLPTCQVPLGFGCCVVHVILAEVVYLKSIPTPQCRPGLRSCFSFCLLDLTPSVASSIAIPSFSAPQTPIPHRQSCWLSALYRIYSPALIGCFPKPSSLTYGLPVEWHLLSQSDSPVIQAAPPPASLAQILLLPQPSLLRYAESFPIKLYLILIPCLPCVIHFKISNTESLWPPFWNFSYTLSLFTTYLKP